MDKKKTALQQAIEAAKKRREIYFIGTPEHQILSDVIVYCKGLLPVERTQIMDAWLKSADKISDEAFGEPMTMFEEDESRELFNQYFNETYETP